MNFVLITSCIALCMHLIRSQLLSVPLNTIVKVGQRVEFECSTNLTTPLRWDFAKVDSTRFQFIYLNEEITSNFSSTFKVDTSRNGHWTLIIDSADKSNAGTYRCLTSPNYHIGEEEMSVSAQLIVLDYDPLCNTNASNYGLVEGDYIRMSCSVSCNGNWIPAMECIRSNGQTVDANIQYSYESSRITLSLVTQVASSDNGITFTCKMTLKPNAAYNISAKVGETRATNIPRYSNLWNYRANVLYGPRNLTIEPNYGIYEVGDRLMCSADGNPSPTFQWTELGTNRVVDGPILTMDKAMELMKTLVFKCTARNRVAGQSASISENATLVITGTPALSVSATTTMLTVSIVITVIGLVALGVGVSLTFKACAQENRERTLESSVQRPDYEMVTEPSVQSGDFGNRPLNQTTTNEESIQRHSAENIDRGGYSSLKRSSSAIFAQAPVYAQLQLYINTSANDD